MFAFLPTEVQSELVELAQAYGQPLVQTVELEIESLFDPLTKRDGRYGEVCMVVRRPNGKLLLAIKTFYPKGAYRLPTGGINQGERILDALLRETKEETGLEVEIRRFLAAVAYRTKITGEQPVFYTFACLLDEIGGTLGVLDESERIEDFREIEPAELPAVVDKLSHLDTSYNEELQGQVRDWGIFRAVIHQMVSAALQG